MIIEFMGTPGSGKTTLQSATADFFNKQKFRAYSVVEAARPIAARTICGEALCRLTPTHWQKPLLWQAFYHLSRLHRLKFFWQHPQLIWMVARFQKERPISETDRKHVLYWFYHHVGYYTFLKAHASAHEVLLFDEGFIHRVVQHYASEHETPNLMHMIEYINLLPKPDLVIYPIASLELCEQRVYERGLWARFQDKSPEEILRYMSAAHTVTQEAAQHIKRRGWTVLEVLNEGVDLATVTADLHRQLAALPQITVKNGTIANSIWSNYA